MTDPKFPPKNDRDGNGAAKATPQMFIRRIGKVRSTIYYQYKQTIPTLSAKWLMSECSGALQYQFFMRNQHMKSKVHIIPNRSKQVEQQVCL